MKVRFLDQAEGRVETESSKVLEWVQIQKCKVGNSSFLCEHYDFRIQFCHHVDGAEEYGISTGCQNSS